MIRSFALLVPLALAATLLLSGCGRRGSAATGPIGVAENGMKELAQVYEYMAANNEPIPRRLEDLDEHEATMPVAYAKIQSGDYVVIWGVGLNRGGGHVVLAYEKDAATSGGLVLMQDGSVKTLSAAEFQAAPKAR